MYNIDEIKNKIICGDCLEVMKLIPDNSVDSIVTDPPYELGFMGKSWDSTGIANSIELWRQCLRVLKPGGYLLSFSATRTYHRMASAIEDAGFEIRDMIEWVYGSGFPKSLNIGKVMDKYLKTGNASWNGTGDSSNGALGYSKLQHNQGYRPADYSNKHQNKEEITEDLAKKWNGWGTALKPAHEPICMAMKPISEKNIAENVLKWGTGGINIDDCRIPLKGERQPTGSGKPSKNGVTYNLAIKSGGNGGNRTPQQGRWPVNFIHDGSEEVLELFPETNSNSPARFFYCAKASRKERGENNNHPTVKPLALMQYLVRLVTPPNGIVLDPFVGSGTTCMAAKKIGRDFIGIEQDKDYCKIAEARINAIKVENKLPFN